MQGPKLEEICIAGNLLYSIRTYHCLNCINFPFNLQRIQVEHLTVSVVAFVVTVIDCVARQNNRRRRWE